VHDGAGGTLTFFAVNRHGVESLNVEISLQGFPEARIVDIQTMTSPDLGAVNTLQEPNAVTPRKGAHAKIKGNALSAKLAPHSYQMIRLSLAAA
jgi:alpha-N-arabinofuranosidase